MVDLEVGSELFEPLKNISALVGVNKIVRDFFAIGERHFGELLQ